MPQLADLQSRRADLVGQLSAINDSAAAEKRDLTDDETKRFDTLETEVRTIGAQIDRAARLNEYERVAETSGETRSDGQPTLQGYSISKALSEGLEGRMTGLENEWHQHLAETRSEVRGTLVPSDVIFQTRAQLTTTPAANPGSNLVATNLLSMTDRRRPPLRAAQLGMTVLQNLTGDIEMPRQVGSGTAHWVSEHQDTSQSEVGFEKKKMSANTVSSEMEMSRKLMNQANEAVDAILSREMSFVMSQALDSAVISGDGADKPTGLLNDALVQEVASAGADIGEDTSLLMQSLELDDVYDEAAFYTSPKISHQARLSRDTTKRPFDTGWIWHGRPFTTSTQVPTNLGAGNDETAIFYGAWSNCYLAFWSGIDILQNPYDGRVSSKGGLLLQAFLDVDFLTRHAEAIRYIKRAI